MAGVTTALIVGGTMALGSAVGGIYSANKAAGTAEAAQGLAADNMKAQADIAARQLAFQKTQQKKLDAQKAIYRDFEFTNPYENMENVYEDLTVNQKQAEFEKQTLKGRQAPSPAQRMCCSNEVNMCTCPPDWGNFRDWVFKFTKNKCDF